MEGLVFSIEEFALFDGPGIRTTVFMKGCAMRCAWCHNPEGLSAKRQLIRNPNGCLHCGKCAPLFALTPEALTEEKIAVCPKGLLRISGKTYTAETLAGMLLKNENILNANGGGITFSGGECLLQADFLTEVLERLNGRLHIAIETGGYVSQDKFARVISNVDLVYFDLKIMDDTAAVRYTGRDSRMISDNFHTLAQSGVPFIVRVPLIPGITDTPENYAAIVDKIKGTPVSYVELLPYNKLAGSKYAAVGMEYTPDFDETREPIVDVEIFEKNGIKVKVY